MQAIDRMIAAIALTIPNCTVVTNGWSMVNFPALNLAVMAQCGHKQEAIASDERKRGFSPLSPASAERGRG